MTKIYDSFKRLYLKCDNQCNKAGYYFFYLKNICINEIKKSKD